METDHEKRLSTTVMEKAAKYIGFEGVSFHYKKSKAVLRDLSFQITVPGTDQGYVTVIMGESGSGKSTILKLILGIEESHSGRISLGPGQPLISYVPQEPVLFEHLTPLQNAKYFEITGNHKDKIDEGFFETMVKTLGLEESMTRKSVTTLSGGQKQRLSLLRALSIKPDFLLLDEPCSGLDADVKQQFLMMLRNICRQMNLAVLYVTHHHEEARMIADEIIYLVKEKDNQVRSVIKGSIQDFIFRTPTIEVAKTFHFPELSIISVQLGNGDISFRKDGETASHYLGCRPVNFAFNNTDGFPFRIVSYSPVFSRLAHGHQNIDLMIDSETVMNNQYFTINGECKLYDPEGRFIQNIYLSNNKIVTNG